MSPSEDQIRALLLGGCEYARDCSKWCDEVTRGSCVSRKRVVAALEAARRAGIEEAAGYCRQAVAKIGGLDLQGADAKGSVIGFIGVLEDDLRVMAAGIHVDKVADPEPEPGVDSTPDES